jgi:hypothetical protein
LIRVVSVLDIAKATGSNRFSFEQKVSLDLTPAQSKALGDARNWNPETRHLARTRTSAYC